MRRFFVILVVIHFGIFFFSCKSGAGSKGESTDFSIVSWNVQTFFDAYTHGSEYSDFRSKEHWSEEKYKERLTRLCEAIERLDADIFVLEEIENEGVILDISNRFAKRSWKKNSNWNYACFAKKQNSAIGCAVLSKYPLTKLRTHSIKVQTQKKSQPSMRPLMEVRADICGKEVVIFVNHWKSKSGGAAESEIWRDWQEFLLGAKVEPFLEDGRVVICGDFNRDASEFIHDFCGGADKNTTFRTTTPGANAILLKVHSPWYAPDGTYTSEIGSYFYKESWERIDHIFTAGNAAVQEFSPNAEGTWANEQKIPVPYKIFSGKGWSDHLPLAAKISLSP